MEDPIYIGCMRLEEFERGAYRTPNSVERPCYECKGWVSVAPSSLRMIEEYPDHEYRFICMECHLAKPQDEVAENIVANVVPGDPDPETLKRLPSYREDMRSISPDEMYRKSGEWVVARLRKRATSDGLVRMKDEVPLGKEYRVDPHSRQVLKLLNVAWHEYHEKEMMLTDQANEFWIATELLEFDDQDG